jgi:hypothetical protein
MSYCGESNDTLHTLHYVHTCTGVNAMGKNAFIVKKVMECEALNTEVDRLSDLLLKQEQDMYNLDDKLKESEAIRVQQQATINRMDEEFWAEKAEVQRLRDKMYTYQTAGEELAVLKQLVKTGWVSTLGMPDPHTIEPFGINGSGVCDPMSPDVGKIATIKVVRSLFNLGLKEAKDIVDDWQRAGKFTMPTNGGA